MTTDELFPAEVVSYAADVGAAEDLRLLRRYEPVLRFTQGELFLPMRVEDYLEKCSLWRTGPRRGRRGRGGDPERLCAPGELTPARLARITAPGPELSLRFVERPLGPRELRAWRREAGRPRLAAAGSRFAAVGLLSRFIDAVMRLSLLLRGRVPGGTTAAAQQDYRAHAEPDGCPYYGRVTRDRGFIALQYWFFYAMNDWRSTFAGVNDHEADWEQVTVFLPDPPVASSRPAWVAFSSHDETGDDLRRRSDDPDLQWQDTHPVVFVGAGSHSGACLPGDYLVSVEPPSLGRMLAVLRRVSQLLLPWTRERAGTSFGLPFIDYHRGDGPGVGPGEAKNWRPVLIDDQTPWVRDYRGLWGLDTGDPFGGERAPAGPRYERGGSVRLCWSDPVGWAGLDKEAPSRTAEQQAVVGRIAELDVLLAAVTAELDDRGDELRRARVGIRALGSTGIRPDLAALETAVQQVRVRRQALAEEREALTIAAVHGLPQEDPHAHLRHRALPNVDPTRTRTRVLRVWSGVSASVLLAGLALVILGQFGALLPAIGGLTVVMLSAEAFARGHLLQFVTGLLALIVVAIAAWLATLATLGHWRVAIAIVLLLAAAAMALASIRDFFTKR
ncbi:MAG: NPP1 family protein [Streptosporangiaceae bacterium]